MEESIPVEPAGQGNGDARTAQRDIVVMGASAGGVETLAELVSGLPAEFPASIFVVLHVLPTAHSVLPEILDRAGPLPAGAAPPSNESERGGPYVAPPHPPPLLLPAWIRPAPGPRGDRVTPPL